MTIHAFNFKSIARAGMLAVVLGTGAVAALPAQAQNFNFSITSPDGLSFSFGNGGFRSRQFQPPRENRYACMSDRELRRQLSRQGFHDIRISDGRRGWVHVSAERRHARYTMDVNACTGTIANLERLDRRHRSDYGWRRR